MSLLDDFVRASKKYPCPKCEKPDWCLLDRANPADPAKVICKRVESQRKWGEAGWFHRLRDEGGSWRRQPRTFSVRARAEPASHFAELLSLSHQSLSKELLAKTAAQLNVTAESLTRLEVGLLTPTMLERVGTKTQGAPLTFPMRDADGALIGMRLRCSTGKFAVKGGKNGLFIPRGLPERIARLLFAEGESDTAALLDLGFDVVGRPGCRNAASIAVAYARRIAPTEIVIVSDGDEAGRSGAADLAREFRVYFTRVLVIAPPEGIKDARAWKIAGARHADIDAVIAASPLVRLDIASAEEEA